MKKCAKLTRTEQGAANIAAIQALKKGIPIPEGFTGWGAIWEVFKPDAAGWAAKVQKELQTLLTPDEYESARASILNAHYTPAPLAAAIVQIMMKLGLRSGKVLEPACGKGVFLDAGSHYDWVGVELDPIPAQLAQRTHSNAQIYNQGFETFNSPDGYFDAAISNVPFGAYQLSESRYNHLGLPIHCHFLAKMVDLVRIGGLIGIITSTGFLDSKGNEDFRLWVAKRCKLLLALRLPSSTFQDLAHTSVTTDLIIFQRVESRDPSADWVKSVPIQFQDNTYLINHHYREHPEYLLGEISVSELYGANDTLGITGGDPVPEILRISQELTPVYKTAAVTAPRARWRERTHLIPPELQGLRPGEFTKWCGSVYQCQDNRLQEVSETRDKGKILDMIQLSEALDEVLSHQGSPTIEVYQESLHAAYDYFRQRWGKVNDAANIALLSEDPRYAAVQALETLDGKKTEIFTQDLTPTQESYSSPEAALAACLNQFGRLDLDWIAENYKETDQ